MKQLHIIYVPGLGDSNVTFQQNAVNTWKWYGASAELFQMKWDDQEAWESKFERLLAIVDAASGKGYDVGIVGASAGASAVVNAFAVRKHAVVGVVFLAGKVNRPEEVGDRYKNNNPAFWTSIKNCQEALSSLDLIERKRILSRYGFIDELVPALDSIVPGATNQKTPTAGHAFTIATQLFFGAPSFIRFLKNQQVS